jgi:hypothetical protein
MPASQDAPGICTLAAGGYSLPLNLTLGSQVHHWSSGTPDMALSMWLPQPRQDFLPVDGWERQHLISGPQQHSSGLAEDRLLQVGQLAEKHIFANS